MNNSRYIAFLAFPLVAACAFFPVYFQLSDTDIWWHLAAGKYILEYKSFIYHDPFSVSAFGNPWIDLHWLFQVIMYLVHSAAGVRGIIIVKAGLFAVTGLILLSIHRQRNTLWLAATVIMTGMFSIRFLVLDRPLVFTLLFLGLEVFFIERFRDKKNRNYLWPLLLIQIAWVNSQGLFMLGPVVLACYVAGDLGALFLLKKSWRLAGFARTVDYKDIAVMAAVGLGLGAACIINPYGFRAFDLSSLIFTRINPSLHNLYAYNVSENIPLWLLEKTDPSRLALFKGFGLLTLLSFLLIPKKLDFGRLLLFLVFFVLGNMAYRNIPLYICVILPVLIANLNEFVFSEPGRQRLLRLPPYFSKIPALLCILIFILLTGWQWLEKRNDDQDSLLGPFRYPIKAVNYLKAHDIPGNIFNSVEEGGYLIWELFPKKLCFVDGRMVLRSPEFFARYLAAVDRPENFPLLRTQYNITQVLLPIGLTRRYLDLAAALYQDPDWFLVYMDAASVVFTSQKEYSSLDIDLRSPEVRAGIVQEADKDYGDNSYLRQRARENIAGILQMIDH